MTTWRQFPNGLWVNLAEITMFTHSGGYCNFHLRGSDTNFSILDADHSVYRLLTAELTSGGKDPYR